MKVNRGLCDLILTMDFGDEGLTVADVREKAGGDMPRGEVFLALRELAMLGRLKCSVPIRGGGQQVSYTESRWYKTGWWVEDGWYRERRDSRVDHIVKVTNGRLGRDEDGPTVWMMSAEMPDGNHYTYERVYVYTKAELDELLAEAHAKGFAGLDLDEGEG